MSAVREQPAARTGVGEAPAAHLNFLQLEERARAARNIDELLFTIANETFRLVKYRQAIIWTLEGSSRPRLRIVSGLASLAEDSPYTVWLRRLGRTIAARKANDGEFIGANDMPAKLAPGWHEWMTDFVLVYPITDPRDERRHGLLALLVEDPPGEVQQQWALRLMHTYGHAWTGLAGKPKRVARGLRKILPWAIPAAALAALLVPVQLSVLAPAEVIGLDALVVAAPMDGVIKKFNVQPNEAVRKDQVIFTLDETTLRNRREVAQKQLEVARADALAAQQKAFEDDKSRAELATLNGKVAERRAEVVYVEELLKRIEVRADRDGIAVFGDVNDWQGKPVVTGERVASLADPKQPGVLIWLPVADALTLEAGAQVKLFLQVAPLTPLPGSLSQTSYQSIVSPEGVASYRLKAVFGELTEDQRQRVRIGLRGTAKIYGAQAPLGYYLFRRPLSALREWTGL